MSGMAGLALNVKLLFTQMMMRAYGCRAVFERQMCVRGSMYTCVCVSGCDVSVR